MVSQGFIFFSINARCLPSACEIYLALLQDVTRPHLSWVNDQRMIVVGTVIEVQEKCVLIETKKGLKRFQEMEVRFRYLQDMAEMIQHAQSVLIVGGGATGVEMAGEIRHHYADKSITLVHSHQYLLNDCPTQQSLKALALLQERKVNVVLEDSVIYDTPVDPFDESKMELARRTYRTKKGQKLEADLLIRCLNGRPNTECMQRHFSHVVRASGKIAVRPTLQTPTHDNVFIAGDIVDLPNCQMVVNLTDMPDVVFANALDVLHGRCVVRTGPGWSISQIQCHCSFSCPGMRTKPLRLAARSGPTLSPSGRMTVCCAQDLTQMLCSIPLLMSRSTSFSSVQHSCRRLGRDVWSRLHRHHTGQECTDA